MFRVFSVMRQLHLQLKYLAEGMQLRPAGPLHPELLSMFKKVKEQSRLDQEVLLALDVAALGRRVAGLLRQVSELVRSKATETRSGGGSKTRRGGGAG